MPRFFFDIHDGTKLIPDDEGQEMSFAAARQAAISALAGIARDELPDGDHHIFVATVFDEHHKPVYRTNLTLDGNWLVEPKERGEKT